MKKLFLFTMMLLSVLAANADDNGTCGENLTWRYDEVNKTLLISGNGAMNNYSSWNNTVPWKQYQKAINEVIIENGVTSIGVHAFNGCSSLTSVTIPNTVTDIGSFAFYGCSGLTSINLPDNITSISSYSFNGCTNLASITIPSLVTTIEEYAFCDCKKITNLVIPKNVKSIGTGVFSGCSGLLTIKVDDDNVTYDSRNNCNAIIETSSNILVTGCRNTIIPYGIVAIGDNAFNNCTWLTSLEMPESVVSLGSDAFNNCWNLATLDISNMIEIGAGCFNSCSKLYLTGLPDGLTVITEQTFSAIPIKTVAIPNKVKEIQKWAFFSDFNLVTVYISESVETLGRGAFSECPTLKNVYCYRIQLPNADKELFVTEYDGEYSKTDLANAVLHVPVQSLELYRTTKPWSDFGNIVALTDEELAIDATTINTNGHKQYFTTDGKLIERPQKGINIVKMSNGQTKKVFVR